MLSTIGVSKESQLRAAKILQVLADTHEYRDNFKEGEAFFNHSYDLMARRWKQLRDAVEKNNIFSLPEFSSGVCTFSGQTFASQPGKILNPTNSSKLIFSRFFKVIYKVYFGDVAFAWLKCKGEVDDCEGFLRGHNIITRSGKHFGDSKKCVRISVLPRDEVFEQFIERLSNITTS